MKKSHKSPLALTLGTTLLAMGSSLVQADTTVSTTSPFAMTELSQGYMQFAEAEAPAAEMKKKDGSCGEAKCGANKMSKEAPADAKATEGKCGGKNMDMKETEGKCGSKKEEAK